MIVWDFESLSKKKKKRDFEGLFLLPCDKLPDEAIQNILSTENWTCDCNN